MLSESRNMLFDALILMVVWETKVVLLMIYGFNPQDIAPHHNVWRRIIVTAQPFHKKPTAERATWQKAQ